MLFGWGVFGISLVSGSAMSTSPAAELAHVYCVLGILAPHRGGQPLHLIYALEERENLAFTRDSTHGLRQSRSREPSLASA